jgi:hypothetical protein
MSEQILLSLSPLPPSVVAAVLRHCHRPPPLDTAARRSAAGQFSPVACCPISITGQVEHRHPSLAAPLLAADPVRTPGRECARQ